MTLSARGCFFKVASATFIKYQVKIIQRSFSLCFKLFTNFDFTMVTSHNSRTIKLTFLNFKRAQFLWYINAAAYLKLNSYIYLNVKELFCWTIFCYLVFITLLMEIVIIITLLKTSIIITCFYHVAYKRSKKIIVFLAV